MLWKATRVASRVSHSESVVNAPTTDAERGEIMMDAEIEGPQTAVNLPEMERVL